jgi:hypothetical protein
MAGELQIEAAGCGALIREVRLVNEEHGAARFGLVESLDHLVEARSALQGTIYSAKVEHCSAPPQGEDGVA